MGEHVQADRSPASPKVAEREHDAGHRTPGGDDAYLSEPPSGALGPALNQRAQVQRLTNLEGAMNAAPRVGGLVQLRASLNSSPTGVAQRAEDADLSNDEWLAKWYAKTPQEKKMTAARKYTQMLNTVLNEKQAEKGDIEENYSDIYVYV